MINPLLKTFIIVIESKSFTKASNILYISSTAIMKQMNTLEKQYNIKLLNRTPNGIKPTPAGEIIYKEAKYMKSYGQNILKKAYLESHKEETTFCVGTSLLNPAKPFMDLWYAINQNFTDYKLHLVPFEDNHEGILSEIQKLGEKFDFLIGVCDSKQWLEYCNFLQLGTYKKMVAVSRDHPFAKKTKIQISDLYDQTLMMVKKGDSYTNDRIRYDLESNHPRIHIENTDQHYDLSVFNRCAETNNILLTIECWKDVHPGLVSIPVDWDYSIPYGLLYSKEAPDDVLEFVKTTKEYIKSTSR